MTWREREKTTTSEEEVMERVITESNGSGDSDCCTFSIGLPTDIESEL